MTDDELPPALENRFEVLFAVWTIEDVIFFSFFSASGVFGSVMVRTPFLKFASILSGCAASADCRGEHKGRIKRFHRYMNGAEE